MRIERDGVGVILSYQVLGGGLLVIFVDVVELPSECMKYIMYEYMNIRISYF